MQKYARKPAIATLLLSLVLGLSAMAVGGQFQRTDRAGSIAQLEAQIAKGNVSATVWIAYADALRDQKRFADAADTYERAIKTDPRIAGPSARFQAALCRGESGDAEKFFPMVLRLTAAEPKAAVDLLQRPELAALRTDPRWDPALRSAKSQAAD